MRSGEAQSTISIGGTYRFESRQASRSVTQLDDDVFVNTNEAQYELSERDQTNTDGSGGGEGQAGHAHAMHRESARNIMEGMGLGVDLAVVEGSEAASMKL